MRALVLVCVLSLAAGFAGALPSAREPHADATAALPDLAVEFESVEIYPSLLTYRHFRFVNVGSVVVSLDAYRWRAWNSDDGILSADDTILIPEQPVSFAGKILQPGESLPQSFWSPWSAQPSQIVELFSVEPVEETTLQDNQIFIDVTAIFRPQVVVPGLAGDAGTDAQMEVTAADAVRAVCADAACVRVDVEVAVSYTYDGSMGSDAELRAYVIQDDACLKPDNIPQPIFPGSHATTVPAVLNRTDPVDCPETPTTLRISSLRLCFARSRDSVCTEILAGTELVIERNP